MDDTIQILVFVVTIIVFIVSAIMQQKKKPNATKSSNFEIVVESLFGIPAEPVRVQKETSNVEYDWNDNPQNTFDLHDEFIDPKLKAHNDKLSQLVKEEGVRAIKVPNDEEVVDVHADEEVEVHSFDFRQAIIYSEIINRKYI